MICPRQIKEQKTMNLPVHGSKYIWSASGIIVKTLLFNIFLSDLSLILNDINNASGANNISLYKACNKIGTAAETLRMSAKELFRWCNYNQMKGKHSLILSTGKSNQIQLGIHWFRAASEEFLGVKFDHKLTFYQHVKSLRKKVNAKCKIKCIS